MWSTELYIFNVLGEVKNLPWGKDSISERVQYLTLSNGVNLAFDIGILLYV